MAGTGPRGPRVGALIVAAAVVALLVPALATGATSWEVGDFKYVKRTVTIPFADSMESTSKGVKVACGAGWDVVSGGGDPKGLSGHTVLSTSGIGGGRAWFTEASHLDSEATKFHGWATCVRNMVVDTATDVEPIGSGPTSDANSVECPSGLLALGGGVRTIGDPTTWFVNSLDPLDTADMDSVPEDGWRAYVAYGAAVPSSFLVDVTCGEDLPEYRSKSVSLPVSAVDGLKAKAKCPAGTRVTGGGGFISGTTLQAHIVASKPIDLRDGDKAPDDGWKVFARNNTGADKTLTVHAICL